MVTRPTARPSDIPQPLYDAWEDLDTRVTAAIHQAGIPMPYVERALIGAAIVQAARVLAWQLEMLPDLPGREKDNSA